MAGDIKVLKELLAAVIAASTAIIPFPTHTGNLFTPANGYAEETSDNATLPDWVPTDFGSALEFRNVYGTTHIQYGLVCLVFNEERECERKGNTNGEPHYRISATDGVMQQLKDDTYGTENSSSDYEVVVYKPLEEGKFEISLIDNWVKSSSLESEFGYVHYLTYHTFYVNEDKTITETDQFSWMPDCVTEYLDYEKNNGEVSVKDDLIIFCLDSAVGTPYTWQQMYTGFGDYAELYEYYDCSKETEIPLDGGTNHLLRAFRATNDGYATIGLEYRDDHIGESDKPAEKTLVADCVVLDNAQTVLLNGQTRVTVTDEETGELISDKYLESYPFKFHADIIYKDELFSTLNGAAANYTVTKNKSILKECYLCPSLSSLSMAYKKADKFEITTEEQPEIIYYDNGAMDLIFKTASSTLGDLNEDRGLIPKKNTIRFKLINADNGKTLCLDDYGYPFGLNAAINYYIENQALPYFISKEFYFDSNPYSLDLSSEVSSGLKIDKISRFDISLYAVPNSCDIITDDIQKTVYENNSMDVIVPISFIPTGDVNFDGNFSISDLVLFQKWLLGDSDAALADWRAADYFNDDKLDVFDLILMRQELIYHNTIAVIRPNEVVRYSNSLTVREDNLKLYLGPNESYDCIADIPAGTRIRELGYMRNDGKWLYTEYNGQNGWIKIVKEDGFSPTINYEAVAAKPVIYLYPEQETDVHVELELTEAELSTTYPKYNNGWDVTAYPDGSLLNMADGTHHKYLFWDALNCRTRFDFSEGFCVAGSDAESFLKEKLTYMGLTEEEMNEFIVYWLPRMEHNKYNLIAFQGNAYTNSAKLSISPNPDSLLRVFMTYVPLDDAVDIQPQQLETFERKGFTVVEWGGSEIKS